MSQLPSPLIGPPPTEVPLTDAPLVRVIAQVRFPLIASVGLREFVAPFQEAIRAAYPILRLEESPSLVLGASGAETTIRNKAIWRFTTVAQDWALTLGPEFLALETTRYTSRDDFLRRLEDALSALSAHISPAVIDRLGIRYIDQLTGESLDGLANLVRPEVAGVLATKLSEHTHHAISETLFTLPDGSGSLRARWGRLPTRGTIDPAAVVAIDEASWVLDLDAYQSEQQTFDVTRVVAQARGFTERIYAFFRWVVTDDFLRSYGGQP